MLVRDWRVDPVAASVALIQFGKRLKRKGLDVESVGLDALRRIFMLYRDRAISRDGVLALMEKAARGEALPEAEEVRPATDEEVRARIAAAKAALGGMTVHNPERKAHILMGLVMTDLRGRVEGADVVDAVRAAAEGTA
jgi:Glu-tRNA(Gln) amidotransferase subunit E-like FAD-binding protein